MKTSLLKLAYGLFIFALVANTAQAQVKIYDHFDYAPGALIGQGGGIGWTGNWVWNEAKPTAVLLNGEVVSGNLFTTIGNKLRVGGDKYAGGDNPARNFTNIANDGSSVFWVGFNLQMKCQVGFIDFGGVSLFNGTVEGPYIGVSANGYIRIADCFKTDAFSSTAYGDVYGDALITENHYYIAKFTFLPLNRCRVDLWADYTGTTPPRVGSSTEDPDTGDITYIRTDGWQATGYFGKEPKADGTGNEKALAFNRVRLASSSKPVTEDLLAVPPRLAYDTYTEFDGLRISSTFFAKDNLTISPLTGVKLSASATANGNLVSWTSESQVNVASLAIERKNEAGVFVNISGPLSVSTTSFKDNNPLDGTNYYKLVSTDNDGKKGTFGPVSVKGLDSDETSVYPNPVTNGELNVVAGKQSINSVSLFDLAGKRVSFKAGNSATKKVTLSTQSLLKGVYILEIKGSKSSSTKKVVVN